jgi:hypothetical protein
MEEMMEVFLEVHQDFDYEELCAKLENLRMYEGDTVDEFLARFRLIYFRFPNHDRPSARDLMQGFS